MSHIDKVNVQEKLYEFPYHYLPWLHDSKIPRLHRHLAWGLDYLTYISFVVSLIRELSPQSLLDIGCGDGRLISHVKSFVPHVVGVDISKQAIAFARAFNPDVEFYCVDITKMSGAYELVTLIEVLEHIPDQGMEGFVQNVARLVEEDGHLLVTVPTVNVPLNKKHYRHYSFGLLRSTLKPHFEIEKHWWLYRQGYLERLLRSFMVNRFYVLNWEPLLALIWRIHKRKTYFADASTGVHLLCLARLAKPCGIRAEGGNKINEKHLLHC